MRIGWEEWALEANKNEKDEYRIRRVSTGWEDWVLEAKKMKRTSTGWEKWALEEKKWKGRVQDELRMRRGSSFHAYPYAYSTSLTRDNAINFESV